jgi:hypothetical protein
VTDVTHKWLVLTFQLPARPTAVRMRVWRQLQRLGAVAVKGGAYVLPNTPQTREDFEWLRAEIAAARGDAALFAADPVDPGAAAALADQFRAAREAEFAALARDAAAARKKRAVDPRELRQFGERLARLQSIDFFGAASADTAAQAVARAAQRQGGHMPTSATTPAPRLRPADYRTRVWVTRPRPGIDRFASAWLVRRFVNPHARVVFAADATAARRDYPKAIPFDMYGVELGHQGGDCTFETLIRRFGLRARGLDALARLVHAVDVKDDRFVVAEAAAVHRLVEGLRRQHADDDVLLERGIEMIDALYEGPAAPARAGR